MSCFSSAFKLRPLHFQLLQSISHHTTCPLLCKSMPIVNGVMNDLISCKLLVDISAAQCGYHMHAVINIPSSIIQVLQCSVTSILSSVSLHPSLRQHHGPSLMCHLRVFNLIRIRLRIRFSFSIIRNRLRIRLVFSVITSYFSNREFC